MGNNLHCCDNRFQDKEEMDDCKRKVRSSIVPTDKNIILKKRKLKNIFERKPGQKNSLRRSDTILVSSFKDDDNSWVTQKSDFSKLKDNLDKFKHHSPLPLNVAERGKSCLVPMKQASVKLSVLERLKEYQNNHTEEEDNPFEVNLSSIPSFDKLLGHGEADISCIPNKEQIQDPLNDSDIELHDQIERSLSNSNSLEKNSNSGCESSNFGFSHLEWKYGTSPKTKPVLDSNYVTFGLTARGRRTNDFSSKVAVQDALKNYSTNDISEKGE